MNFDLYGNENYVYLPLQTSLLKACHYDGRKETFVSSITLVYTFVSNSIDFIEFATSNS